MVSGGEQGGPTPNDATGRQVNPSVKRKPVAIPPPPELGQATITGSFPEMLKVVSKTSASLHIIPGHVEVEDGEPPRKYLLPFAEFRLGGGGMVEMETQGDDQDPPTLIAATVSLENMAFMVLDLMGDLRGLCSEASSVTGGRLAMDPTRMAHVRYFVAHIERQARACRVELDRAFGEPKPTPE